MNKELLFEIGTEEIPAGFLSKAVIDMEEISKKLLAENRIACSGIKCLATPRRLVLYIAELGDKQKDEIIEKIGPAKKAAFDEGGKPTKAALGFARGLGIDPSELQIITTEKGEYVGARKQVPGRPTQELLPEILKAFVLAIPFRKSMRWADYDLRFARPIHWFLAIYDGKTIPLQMGNVVATNESYGHRFMSPAPFAVADFKDYLSKTRENHVIVDHEERKKIVLTEAQKAAAQAGGKLYYTEELLETVTFLVEYPVIIRGGFDEKYLKIPKEVIITTMISHQKYFPVTNEKEELLPCFIAVSNTKPRDENVVARGNERVLRARLADAQFFFEEDKKIPLEDRVDSLKKVVFHSLLGTSYEKVMRFRKLALKLAQKINPALSDNVDRAALLAKADLETQMVGEFSELQGIIGREYARLAGEKPPIAEAIYEHYLPVVAGGALPQTDEGAIVGIADKMDSIVGFFGVGLSPSGTADPYALRRQAIGIINIILFKRYALTLDYLFEESFGLFQNIFKKTAAEIKKDVLQFFAGRLENLFIAQGYSYDTVAAVLASDFSDLIAFEEKVKALHAFRNNPDFEPISIAFKRVDNILKGFNSPQLDPKLFVAEAEKNLFTAFKKINENVTAKIKANDYLGALTELAFLRPFVDAFFDNVMVMDKDKKIQINRLSLLTEISVMFHKIADFSKIATSG
ncbi:MAG TPA: glycine--tRNA ligase subunit beta [Smithellaceae bacterium]|nr:glycine--tRNA ligase subunit beta [Smithellaceae bacterium]HRS89732.1 glycine--tRNA ligase subunit beta [Smithellaceae bacterium]HRV26866.1 glycine--tRNA ligase subunit beta [Smithellaceae bacterium]